MQIIGRKNDSYMEEKLKDKKILEHFTARGQLFLYMLTFVY